MNCYICRKQFKVQIKGRRVWRARRQSIGRTCRRGPWTAYMATMAAQRARSTMPCKTSINHSRISKIRRASISWQIQNRVFKWTIRSLTQATTTAQAIRFPKKARMHREGTFSKERRWIFHRSWTYRWIWCTPSPTRIRLRNSSTTKRRKTW